MTKNKLLWIPVGAVTAALTLGSIAYACTAVVGQIKITALNSSTGLTCNTAVVPAATGCTVSVASGATDSRKVVAEVPSTTPTRANTAFYMTFLNRISDQDGVGTCTASILPSHPDLKMYDSASTGTAPTPTTPTTPSPSATAVTSTSAGVIASTTRYIPHDVHPDPPLSGRLVNHAAHNGTASICWVSADSGYATNDATVTITGGSS